MAALAVVYVAVYPFMLWEPSNPPEKDLSNPLNYTWFFIVTVATVGYGDISPVTTIGRIGGALLIVAGVALLAVVIGKIGSWIFQRREQMLSGLKPCNVSGHAVVIGYHPTRTERLVRQLQAGGHIGEVVLICAGLDQVSTHPMPDDDNVLFVRGDLEDLGFLREFANVHLADRIILDGGDDHVTLALALVVARLGCSGHIVAAIQDMSRRERFRHINSCIEVAPAHSLDLIVDAAHDPGVSEVYAGMQDNTEAGASMHSVVTPKGWTGASLADVELFFRQKLHARIQGVRAGTHLDDPMVIEVVDDYVVKAGYTIYYVAAHRLTEIPWSQIRPPLTGSELVNH